MGPGRSADQTATCQDSVQDLVGRSIRLINKVVKLVRYAVAGWLPGGSRFCVMCSHRVWRYMPYRSGSRGRPALSAVLQVVGSDPDNFECPRCGCHDRERHLYMYMETYGILRGLAGMRILHFAPERMLSRKLVAANPREYTRCDLFPKDPDTRKVNVEDMPFPDGSFDLVIANHILEHVDNVERALAEIRRVLVREGRAILQTPFSPVLQATWCDPGITSPEARLQAYGQEDHVRLFGRDIFDRFESCGLVSHVAGHAEILPDIDAKRYGVNVREPFFLFQKNESPDVGNSVTQ